MFRQAVWLQRSHSTETVATMHGECDRLHDRRYRASPAAPAGGFYGVFTAGLRPRCHCARPTPAWPDSRWRYSRRPASGLARLMSLAGRTRPGVQAKVARFSAITCVHSGAGEENNGANCCAMALRQGDRSMATASAAALTTTDSKPAWPASSWPRSNTNWPHFPAAASSSSAYNGKGRRTDGSYCR